MPNLTLNPGVTAIASMTWDPTPDTGGSGLAGYRFEWDHAPVTLPNGPLNLGPVTSVVSHDPRQLPAEVA